jgi:hypothetical protein
VKLLGISGLKRSGKNETAAQLKHIRSFRSLWPVEGLTTELAFADTLRDVLKTLFGFSGEQMFGDLKEVKDEYWGISYREAAQKIGTDLLRNQFMPDIWIRAWQRRARHHAALNPQTLVIATDCRFENEVNAIRDLGGEVWRVQRPGVVFDGHESERLAATAPDEYFDRNLINDGTLDDLREKVRAAAAEADLL